MSSKISVPLLDLKAQYEPLRDEIEAVIKEVCDSQWFIGGPHVEGLERAVADYCGAKHAIGVSSGTDAELVGLMALDLKPGDEVITTPYTFFATVGGVVRCGATPIFVDIDPETFNIDVSQIADKITSRTKAIIPVHLFGQCADMDPILELASNHGLNVAEDSAQAIGARYKGKMAGNIGDWSYYSFFPSKNLGGFGDGGMVTTNDDEFAHRLRMLRNHGMEPKYYHQLVGGNFRLDALQAAVLEVKLKHLNSWHEGRRENARRYEAQFVEAEVALPSSDDFARRAEFPVVLPGGYEAGRGLTAQEQFYSVVNQFVIRTQDRDGLLKHLRDNAIGCEVYYPVPLHLQQCFADLGYKEGSMPHSERAAKETVALPIYPEMSEAQLEHVVNTVSQFVAGK